MRMLSGQDAGDMLQGRSLGHSKQSGRDFPGGAVVKNPPANAGDKGSSPGRGRYNMPQSNKVRAPQLLSPRA